MSAIPITLSSKGQVVVPKVLRDESHWRPGARLLAEKTKEGVLLKTAPLFPPTTLEQVVGCLAYQGPAKTIDEMDAAVLEEAMLQNPRLGSDLDCD